MQIVIDIPNRIYKIIQNKMLNIIDAEILEKAVKNGTPLPKGHGRILDEKEILNTEKHDGGWYDLVDLPEYIKGVPGIVEADKEQT